MNNPQRVLVTGGAGFIGSALSHVLAESSERWVAVDSMHPQVHPTPERPTALHSSAELVIADVADENWWDQVLDDVRPDVVVHLAAETGTAQSLDEATRHTSANVVGTSRLIDALGRSGRLPERIILSSSRAVYGEGRWQRADGSVFLPGQRSHAQLEASEWDFPGSVSLPSSSLTTTPTPTSVYAATKLAQEHVLSVWGSSRGVPITVHRFQNVYGPGQSLSNPYTGIVSLFSQLAQRGESIPVYEDGNITRDFVYIDDVVAAVAATMTSAEPYTGPALDIGSGVGTTIFRLAEIIAEYHGAPAPHITGAFRDGDVRHAHCEIVASTAALEWSPKWSVESGIAALQDWIAEETAERTR